MKNSHLKDSLVAALIAVFAGVSTLGVNVALGEVPASGSPANVNLVAPTFSGLDVRGDIKNSTGLNADGTGAVHVNDDLDIQGSIYKKGAGDVFIDDGLKVQGGLDVYGFSIKDTGKYNGLEIPVYVTDDLYIGTNSTFPLNAGILISQALSEIKAVAGALTLNKDTGGPVNIGSVVVPASLNVNGTVSVSGDTTLNTVSAGTFKASNVTTTGPTTAGSLYSNGKTFLKDTLDVTGASTLGGDATILGKVGIGTSNPAAKLDVNGTIKSSILTGEGSRPVVADANGILGVGAAPASPLWTASGLNISNTNTGNVGIGTNAPTAKLEVNGNTLIKTGDLDIQAGVIKNSVIGERLKLNDADGIDILGDIKNETVLNAPVTFNDANGVAIKGGNLDIHTGNIQNTASLVINILNKLAVTGDATVSGNLGVGTITPTSKLDVAGGIVTKYIASTISNMASGLFVGGEKAVGLRFGIGVQNGLFYQGSNDGLNSNFDFRKATADGSLGAVNARIQNDGKVGIGTDTPNSKLDILLSALPAGITKIAQFTLPYTNVGEIPMLAVTNTQNTNVAGIAFPLSSGGQDGDIAFYNTKSSAPAANPAFRETMRITGPGNVGIGTTNPTQGKVVSVTTDDYIPSYVATTKGLTNGEKSYYSFYAPFGSGVDVSPRRSADITAGFDGGTWGKEFLTLNVGLSAMNNTNYPTSEKMRIQGNGNVGIGTSAPVSNFAVSQPIIGIGTITTQQDTALYGTNTQFTNTFKIGDSITFCDGVPSIIGFCVGGTVSETRTISAIPSDTELTVSVASTLKKAGLRYMLSGGDRFAVKGNGNVGIGTTTPIAPLDVKTGNLTPSTQMMIRGGSGIASDQGVTFATDAGTDVVGKIGHLGTITGLWSFDMWTDENAPLTFWNNKLERMRIAENGNVGIGTKTPGAKLEVNGNETITGSLSLGNQTNGKKFLIYPRPGAAENGDFMQITNDNADGSWDWSNGLTLKRGGNVGIGTVNPSQKLSVNGFINTSPTYTNGLWDGNRKALYIDPVGNLGVLPSSQRFKENVKNMEDVSWLYSLRPVIYNYIKDQDKAKQYGLIAEEVDKINPAVVTRGNDGKIDTVFYEALISPIIKAIQDQKSEIDQLKAENAEIKSALCEIKPALKLCR